MSPRWTRSSFVGTRLDPGEMPIRVAAADSPPTSSGCSSWASRERRQEPHRPPVPDLEPLAELGDLAADGLDLVLAQVRPAGVEPLVARQSSGQSRAEVVEEVLAGPGPEVQDVRPDRGRAGVAGGPHDVARGAPAGPTARAGSAPSRRRRRSRRRRACAAPGAAGAAARSRARCVRQIASVQRRDRERDRDGRPARASASTSTSRTIIGPRVMIESGLRASASASMQPPRQPVAALRRLVRIRGGPDHDRPRAPSAGRASSRRRTSTTLS